MKIVILAVALAAVFSSPTMAEKGGAKGYCAQIAGTARAVMTQRQAGVPLSEMMAIANDSAPIVKMTRSMVMGAYEIPRMDVPGYVDQTVESYGTRWELMCHWFKLEK